MGKIEIEVVVRHWWIERADIAKNPKAVCRAMVHLVSDDDHKLKIEKEELFESLDEAVQWVKENIL